MHLKKCAPAIYEEIDALQPAYFGTYEQCVEAGLMKSGPDIDASGGTAIVGVPSQFHVSITNNNTQLRFPPTSASSSSLTAQPQQQSQQQSQQQNMGNKPKGTHRGPFPIIVCPKCTKRIPIHGGNLRQHLQVCQPSVYKQLYIDSGSSKITNKEALLRLNLTPIEMSDREIEEIERRRAERDARRMRQVESMLGMQKASSAVAPAPPPPAVVTPSPAPAPAPAPVQTSFSSSISKSSQHHASSAGGPSTSASFRTVSSGISTPSIPIQQRSVSHIPPSQPPIVAPPPVITQSPVFSPHEFLEKTPEYELWEISPVLESLERYCTNAGLLKDLFSSNSLQGTSAGQQLDEQQEEVHTWMRKLEETANDISETEKKLLLQTCETLQQTQQQQQHGSIPMALSTRSLDESIDEDAWMTDAPTETNDDWESRSLISQLRERQQQLRTEAINLGSDVRILRHGATSDHNSANDSGNTSSSTTSRHLLVL